jgi:hypothetical protein
VPQCLNLTEAADQTSAEEDERHRRPARALDQADAHPRVVPDVYLLERVALTLEEAPGPPAGTAAGPGVDQYLLLVHSHLLPCRVWRVLTYESGPA